MGRVLEGGSVSTGGGSVVLAGAGERVVVRSSTADVSVRVHGYEEVV